MLVAYIVTCILGLFLAFMVYATWWSSCMNRWDCIDPRFSDLTPGVNAGQNHIGKKDDETVNNLGNPSNCVYVVTGGCGFIGSWVVRYLVRRGEKDIRVVDKCRKLPRDLTSQSVVSHIQLDLAVEDVPLDKVGGRVVVFHCAAVVKYHGTMNDNIENVQMAERISSQFPDSVVVYVGDYLSTLEPGQWVQTAPLAGSSSPKKGNKFISPYAESMSIAEDIIMRMAKGRVVRPQGLVSGHYGDAFLSPALDHNGGLLHSWNVPLCLVHVEDVAEACLHMESVRSMKSVLVTISNNEVTTLERIYVLIGAIRPFKTIRVNPVLVLLMSKIVSAAFTKRETTRREASLLTGAAHTLTPQRFYVLQIGQLPNDENSREAERLLRFRCKRGITSIVTETIKEELSKPKMGSSGSVQAK